jgi:DNA-binding transcriptional LysR family regulator
MIDSTRIQQLDLNLLKVFQALYQEQNMTRTAEVLHLTPSAVSHAMKRLRDVLGDPLFIRSRNKMVPTAACQRMAPSIVDTLSRLQQILQQWGEFDPLTSTHNFRVGMHDALESSVLPQLIKILARRAPSIGISSVKVDRTNLERELGSGHIDIALDMSMSIKKPVKQHKIWTSGFCVVMRKNHPLRENLTQQNYLDSQHIIVSNRPLGMTMEDTFFQQQGLQRKTSIRCQNYFAATKILTSSDQLLTITKSMAEQLLSSKLCLIEAPFTMPKFGTSVYWHENTEHDSALSWLRSILIEMQPSD